MAKGGNGGGKGKPGGDSEWTSITGNKRDNELFGTDGKDAISGKDGNDILHGGDLEDLLIGGNGDDILYGDDGPDRLHGGDGNDELYGGLGNDQLQGGTGSDVMDGGDGYDVASFVEIAATSQFYDGLIFTTAYDGTNSTYTAYNPDTTDTDTVTNVEELRGSNYDDTMTGGDGADYFVGARGEDTIDGGGGNDTLYGSLEDDELTTGTGSDTLIFLRYNTNGNGADDDTFALGDGHDVVWDFNVTDDTILFLVNETFTPTAEIVTDDPTTTEIVEPDGTLITYATDSTILLVGVFDADLNTVNIQEEMITL